MADNSAAPDGCDVIGQVELKLVIVDPCRLTICDRDFGLITSAPIILGGPGGWWAEVGPAQHLADFKHCIWEAE